MRMYYRLYRLAPPERATIFRLQVLKGRNITSLCVQNVIKKSLN